MSETKSIAIINKQIAEELKDPAIARALLATTFKGLQEQVMKQAIFEGVTRGFTFQNFLEGDLYAIPFGQGYSLVTSIKFANKIAQKNGVWVSGPKFEMDGKKIESCSITAYRRIGQDIGEWTATVFFDEYNTDKNLWKTKPRTMLAKVCLSHVYRMACPEEMSQVYTEEEFDKEKEGDYDHSPIDDAAVPTVHIGDDHGEPKPNLVVDRASAEHPDIPESEEERLNLIKALIIKRLPKTYTRNSDELKTAIEDETQLSFTTPNYEAIIKSLRN